MIETDILLLYFHKLTSKFTAKGAKFVITRDWGWVRRNRMKAVKRLK